MPTTVYAVCREGSSDYDDYRVEGLYWSRSEADACIGRGVGDWVEELTLYGTGDESLRRRTRYGADARIDPDGTVALGYEWSTEEVSATEPAERHAEEVRLDQRGFYRISASGASVGAARSAARERGAQVARWMAQGVNPIEAAAAATRETE